MRPPDTRATSDEARGQPGFIKGAEATENSSDCAPADAERKQIAGPVARAALLGLEVHRLADGAWLLRHQAGAHIGIVRGVDALGAAVAGVEAAQADVRELVQSLRGAA